MSYSYNADGIRVSKNVNDVRHEYYLDGSRIVKETWANQTLEFLYDENNSVYCIVYTGGDGAGRYYLIKNLQGDVTRILNNNLETVAQYVYDPWGKLVSILDANGEPNSGISIANINPIRYRGYYFDMETGFYYLNARYYDPALGRFINPDSFVTTGQGLTSYNMYAYCGNNPIYRIDSSGAFWDTIKEFFKKAKDVVCDGAQRFVNALGGSFECEVGVGYGIGGSAGYGTAEVSVTAYQDPLTFGLKSGSLYTAIQGSAGLSAQLAPNLAIGYSTEYEHRFETDTKRNDCEHTTLSAPWQVYGCPITTQDPLQFNFPFSESIDGSMSDSIFFGASGEAHFGLGGHYSIGWDLGEFWRILTE